MTNQTGRSDPQSARLSRLCIIQGDSDMKKLLCATNAYVGIRASMISALLCAAAFGPASAAPAGNTPAENNTGLEEIVVTAEKRESTVQATPIAMTALSASDLAEQNIGSIQGPRRRNPRYIPAHGGSGSDRIRNARLGFRRRLRCNRGLLHR